MHRRDFLNSVVIALTAGFAPLPVSARSKRAPTGFIRTNWSKDPFSLGAYSFVAKDASRKDHKALGVPIENSLFFAGEATHPEYNSTVHAAYESGLMAAEAVYDLSLIHI